MYAVRYFKAFIAHASEQFIIIRGIALEKLPEFAVREMMSGGRFSYIRRLLEYIHRVKYFWIFRIIKIHSITFISAF